MWKPKKSNPSSMWVIIVFSSDRRKPIGEITAATSSRTASVWVRVPLTSTTKSSAYRTRR